MVAAKARSDRKQRMSPRPATTAEVEPFADVGVLRDLVGYHLRRATNVMVNDFARALAGTGMRQVLFGIVAVVAANPGIKQGSAGASLGIQRANMVALINQLVEAGLIDRQVSPEDRRAFSLRLTPQGEQVHAECMARIRAHEDALLADLSEEERRMLIRLLSRIEAHEA
jgi:DNA-binding MarR family transcriptional regulator